MFQIPPEVIMMSPRFKPLVVDAIYICVYVLYSPGGEACYSFQTHNQIEPCCSVEVESLTTLEVQTESERILLCLRWVPPSILNIPMQGVIEWVSKYHSGGRRHPEEITCLNSPPLRPALLRTNSEMWNSS